MLERIREELRDEEGKRLKPYRDTEGVWTIGYGRNLRDGITEAEAEFMLESDIAQAFAIAVEMYGHVWRDLNDIRRGIIVKMAFQLGRRGLFRFERFRKAVEAGDHEAAAAELLDSKVAKYQAPRRWEKHAAQWKEGVA